MDPEGVNVTMMERGKQRPAYFAGGSCLSGPPPK